MSENPRANPSKRTWWARWLKALLPKRVWLQMYRELGLTLLRFKCVSLPWHGHRWIRKAARLGELKLHMGCGEISFPDWVNIDGSNFQGVDLQWDIRTRLPFSSQSVEAIYCHHVLEHLEYPDESGFFMSEFHRVLKPGGALRLVVPDMQKYVTRYANGDREFFEKLNRLGGGPPMRTPCEVLNKMFRMGGSHQFAYDFDTLCLNLTQIGFAEVTRLGWDRYGDPCFAGLDRPEPWFRLESLYVEAKKPVASTHQADWAPGDSDRTGLPLGNASHP